MFRMFNLSPLCRYAGKVLLRPLAPHTLYHARVAAANSYGLRCVAEMNLLKFANDDNLICS